MNKKIKENEKYIKLGMTGAMVVLFGLIVFFILYREEHFAAAAGIIVETLRSFVYGAAIAYILRPLCAWFERLFDRLFRQKHPGLSLALSIFAAVVIALVIVLAVLLLIIPQLADSIATLLKILPEELGAIPDAINDLLEKLHVPPAVLEYWQNYLAPPATDMTADINTFISKNLSQGNLGDNLMKLVPGLASQVVGTLGIILDLFIGVIVSIYLLFRRRKLAAQMKLIIYGAFKSSWADWIVQEFRFANHVFNGFFMGKLIDSSIVGIICFFGCLFMGFSSPILIAVIVGVTNIIPFFGPYIGAIPCILLLLLEKPVHALMFLVFIIVLQQLDGNIIGPKILGDSTGLSALWVMFAILLFGGLWGIIGMLIGVPLMAVIYDIVRQITVYNVHRRGKDDMVKEYYDRFHPAEMPAAEHEAEVKSE